MTIREWFTARELAEIAKERSYEKFPHTESAAIRRIKREGWNDLPKNLCRPREGREGGGGREYHRSLLPETLQAAFRAMEIKTARLAEHNNRLVSEARKVAAIPLTTLRFRQRNAMEARGEILAAITGYDIANGLGSRRKAILDFIRAQDEHAEQLKAQERAKAGEVITDRDRMLLERPSLLEDMSGFGVLADTLRIANDRSGGDFRVSRATLYEWFKLRDTRGITALVPAPTKVEEPVSDEFKTFLSFYARPSKPAMTEALKDFLKANPDSRLSLDAVRYTLRCKLNDIEKNVGREGLLTLRSRMAYIQRSTENLFPTTIYTADGKTFDAEVAHPVHGKPFKPEITSILDVATRRCVGFAIALKENVISVTEALRNACCDHGIPAIFYTDRGPGYKNKTFDADVNGLMGRLSITKMHALPYNSQAKGIIERFNGTVWNPLARKLPTYLGEEMDKEAAKAAHKASRRDIAQFGTSRLLPSWAEFRTMCEEAIAEYNATPHHGLPRYRDEVTGRYLHYSPDAFWALHAGDGFEAVPVDDDVRDDLFRPYEIRVARRAMVEWNSNTYFHAALEAYHGEKVMVGYDFAEARHVWVREIDRHAGQPGPLICVADFAGNKVDYVPKSYQKAAEEKRHQGRIKRIENKRRDIDAEIIAPFLIEQSALEPMPIIDVAATATTISSAPVLVIDNNTTPSPTAAGSVEAPRRRTFASDEELAAWALEHPDQLTSNQVRVLRDCLNRHSAAELFRMSGIDVEALRSILRAAA